MELGYIRVTDHFARYESRMLALHCTTDFFEDGFTITDTGDSLLFKRVGVDHRGKFQNPKRRRVGNDFHYSTAISGTELPLGQFKFDEDDSTEDELVIYYN